MQKNRENKLVEKIVKKIFEKFSLFLNKISRTEAIKKTFESLIPTDIAKNKEVKYIDLEVYKEKYIARNPKNKPA